MKEIIVTIPDNNVKERTYVCSFMMKLLGLKPVVKVSPDAIDYVIKLANGKKIVIKDGFFNNFPKELSYLSIDNIPTESGLLKAFDTECHYLFGKNIFTIEKDIITIGADFFASAFFVLSRWEEFLRGREAKGDCDEMELFLVKSGYYKYPIVNEYEYLLRECFKYLGEEIESDREFKVGYSLDVDNYQQVTWGGVWRFTKDCLKNHSLIGAINSIWNNTLIKAYTSDRTRLFRKHMKIASKSGLPVEFYFKCCTKGDRGRAYEWNDHWLDQIKKCLENNNGSEGFHPCQSTLNNNEQFERECSRYRTIYKKGLNKGRNHTLLFNTNSYHQFLEGGFTHISNGGFHKLNGFRCGIGVSFPVFDIYKREELPLIEEPFHIMDMAVRKTYSKMMDSWDDVKLIIDNAKKYNCTLILNWHIVIYFSWRVLKDSFKLADKILDYSLNNAQVSEII